MSIGKDSDNKAVKPDSVPVNVRETGDSEKPLARTFPGPRNAKAKLRVAVKRGAYADLIAHAKGSLEAEVCGVLAGQVCEDDEGLFVNVEAIICGTAASQGSTHVTFTQETWNAIHNKLEHDYPNLKIVGWYHTHPGFGVEFSEMDLFIQRNFFPGPTHLALVTDPLNGAVAICMNAPEGIEYLDRFWVDGREQQCRKPERPAAKQDGTQAANMPGETDKLRALEERMGQLVQALDEMRTFHYRFMLTCGFVLCLTVILGVGYTVYKTLSSRYEPPKLNQIVPVPVQIGDKRVILGVGITSWEVPPELDAILIQAEMLQRQEAEKAAQKEAEKEGKVAPGTNAGSATVTNSPPLTRRSQPTTN
jgi:proteasome lid subunit RPN8/RPN11